MKTMTGFVLLALVATAAGALHVEVSVRPGVDFGAYRTFGFLDRPGDELALGGDEALDEEVRAAAAGVLEGKGLEAAADGEPHLRVSFTGFVEDELAIEGVRKEITRHVAWVGDPENHSVRSHQTGTLVIEIVDAERERIVWSGWATGVARTPVELREKATRAVRRILRHFPPD